MELQRRNPCSKVRSKSDKISLEEYMEFLLSHKQLHLNFHFLNQIISMHGFKKLYRVPKNVLTDAVKTLDLVDPSRSTLNESVSSLEFVALEDVIADLNHLNWQECCVTSIQTLKSWNHSVSAPVPNPTHPKGSDPKDVGEVYGGDGASSSCIVRSKPHGLPRKVGSKRKRTNAVMAGGGDGTGDGGFSSGGISLGSLESR